MWQLTTLFNLFSSTHSRTSQTSILTKSITAVSLEVNTYVCFMRLCWSKEVCLPSRESHTVNFTIAWCTEMCSVFPSTHCTSSNKYSSLYTHGFWSLFLLRLRSVSWLSSCFLTGILPAAAAEAKARRSSKRRADWLQVPAEICLEGSWNYSQQVTQYLYPWPTEVGRWCTSHH